LGLGGRLGSGQQWMSWIALDDVVGLLKAAISDEKASGPVNVVAPAPVRNSEFTQVLASVLHRPAIFPAPAFALRLLLGEMADALLLSSQQVHSERAPTSTYHFRNENLEPALHAILSRK
jgi:NAD dependent epimerase/dehydratase family enzyme